MLPNDALHLHNSLPLSLGWTERHRVVVRLWLPRWVLSHSLGVLVLTPILSRITCFGWIQLLYIRQPCGEAHPSSVGSGCFKVSWQPLSEFGSRFFPNWTLSWLWPSQRLNCNSSGKTVSQRHSVKQHPGSWPTNTKVINTCFFVLNHWVRGDLLHSNHK